MAEIITKDRKEYNIWDKINSKWNRLNFLTNAKSVDFDDGKTAQTKLGAIDGITSDLSGESETVAASIKCVNQLNSSLENIKTIYSTDEVDTGNKWIDGKSIYRRTFIGNTPSSNDSVIFTVTNMDTLIDMYGVLVHTDGVSVPLNTSYSSSDSNAIYINANGEPKFYVNGNMVYNNPYKITVEYTKK